MIIAVVKIKGGVSEGTGRKSGRGEVCLISGSGDEVEDTEKVGLSSSYFCHCCHPLCSSVWMCVLVWQLQPPGGRAQVSEMSGQDEVVASDSSVCHTEADQPSGVSITKKPVWDTSNSLHFCPGSWATCRNASRSHLLHWLKPLSYSCSSQELYHWWVWY